jgi:hypothetical protein
MEVHAAYYVRATSLLCLVDQNINTAFLLAHLTSSITLEKLLSPVRLDAELAWLAEKTVRTRLIFS